MKQSCLLLNIPNTGHNGAGKTTLSEIISCQVAPSGGDVFVFGYSATEDPDSIRSMVGLCKQGNIQQLLHVLRNRFRNYSRSTVLFPPDDYLWPTLTVREHLELYAGLRGIHVAALGDIVDQWLESVELADVQGQYSSTLSGGTKRRLSVALATIGDRALIILDEPTTGMCFLRKGLHSPA